MAGRHIDTNANTLEYHIVFDPNQVSVLDVLLALAFLGGLSVPIGHLTLKWLFNRYLKRTQEEGASQDS